MQEFGQYGLFLCGGGGGGNGGSLTCNLAAWCPTAPHRHPTPSPPLMGPAVHSTSLATPRHSPPPSRSNSLWSLPRPACMT